MDPYRLCQLLERLPGARLPPPHAPCRTPCEDAPTVADGGAGPGNDSTLHVLVLSSAELRFRGASTGNAPAALEVMGGFLLSADVTDEDRHGMLHPDARRLLAPAGAGYDRKEG